MWWCSCLTSLPIPLFVASLVGGLLVGVAGTPAGAAAADAAATASLPSSSFSSSSCPSSSRFPFLLRALRAVQPPSRAMCRERGSFLFLVLPRGRAAAVPVRGGPSARAGGGDGKKCKHSARAGLAGRHQHSCGRARQGPAWCASELERHCLLRCAQLLNC